MTHGHELKVGNAGGRVCAGWRRIKGGKRDNCNKIINKIYFRKEIKIEEMIQKSLLDSKTCRLMFDEE